jgi:hypothetical protein
MFVVVTVNPIILTYRNTQEDAHCEDSPLTTTNSSSSYYQCYIALILTAMLRRNQTLRSIRHPLSNIKLTNLTNVEKGRLHHKMNES